MGMRGLTLFIGGALAVLALSRCSFLIGGFNECAQDSDCSGGRVCVGASPDGGERYCVAQVIPEGCLGVPDAGVLATYGPADAGNVIHLGAAYAVTSGTSGVSDTRVEQLNGVVLALEEINQRRLVGQQVVLHVCDTNNDNERLRAQLAWMADTLHVPAVLIPSSSQVLAAASVTVPRGVLLMSPTATSTDITALAANTDAGTRMVWRTAPSDAIQAKAISDLMLGTSAFDAGLATKQKVGILYENDPYGQGLNASVLDALTGNKTVQSFQYARGGDITSAVSQLDGFHPDVTLLVAFPEDAPRIVTAGLSTSSLKPDAGHQWLFTDSAKDPKLYTQTAAGVVEGNYGTAAAQGAGSQYAIFANSFQSRFGVNPDSYAFTAHNYDAMYVLAYGMAYALGSNGQGALTGEHIAQGLAHLSSGTALKVGPTDFVNATSQLGAGGSIDITGTSGELNFNPVTGEAPSQIEIWQVRGQSFVTAAKVQPAP